MRYLIIVIILFINTMAWGQSSINHYFEQNTTGIAGSSRDTTNQFSLYSRDRIGNYTKVCIYKRSVYATKLSAGTDTIIFQSKPYGDDTLHWFNFDTILVQELAVDTSYSYDTLRIIPVDMGRIIWSNSRTDSVTGITYSIKMLDERR